MTERAVRFLGSLSALVVERSEATEFYFSGEFDLENVSSVEDQLLGELEGCSRLVVDLSGLTFMDSSAIGALVRTKKACELQRTTLVLRLGESPVRRVLDLIGMNEFLGVKD